MSLTMRRWMAVLAMMLLAMSLTVWGASAETAAADTAQVQMNDEEQNDQAETDTLSANVQISLTDAETAFQALYPDWTIISARLEEEDNAPAYSIEAIDMNGAMIEATISALDGTVIPERSGDQNEQEGQDKGEQENESENGSN